jgi:hypothetical protein
MADRRLYVILARHFFNKFSTEDKTKKKNQKESNGAACGK